MKPALPPFFAHAARKAHKGVGSASTDEARILQFGGLTVMLLSAYRNELLISGDEWDSLQFGVQDTVCAA
jgi:hypothetical protein